MFTPLCVCVCVCVEWERERERERERVMLVKLRIKNPFMDFKVWLSILLLALLCFVVLYLYRLVSPFTAILWELFRTNLSLSLSVSCLFTAILRELLRTNLSLSLCHVIDERLNTSSVIFIACVFWHVLYFCWCVCVQGDRWRVVWRYCCKGILQWSRC